MVFAHDVSDMLNIHMRPVTAKRHRAPAEDRRDRDGADEFRGDLAIVRTKLWEFAKKLPRLAYGGAELEARQSPPAMSAKNAGVFPKCGVWHRANALYSGGRKSSR